MNVTSEILTYTVPVVDMVKFRDGGEEDVEINDMTDQREGETEERMVSAIAIKLTPKC